MGASSSLPLSLSLCIALSSFCSSEEGEFGSAKTSSLEEGETAWTDADGRAEGRTDGRGRMRSHRKRGWGEKKTGELPPLDDSEQTPSHFSSILASRQIAFINVSPTPSLRSNSISSGSIEST